MSDIIASARNMTVVAEGQYNTVGLPKGSLTPATITAMVGFSRGEGLQMHPDISSAVTKLRAVYLTNPSLGTAANTAADDLESHSNNMMLGGPAGFMEKFNQARAHIGDAIELKKVTAFCSNVSLSSFGSGVSKMSDLADQGLSSKLGNLANVGDCMAATGGLFDMKDMSSFGKPAGLISKMMSSKMSNATGLTGALKQAGVDTANLNDPVYAGQIDKAMAKINDPKVLSAVAEQFNVSLPTGSLPSVPTTNLTDGLASAAAANPFSGLPSAGSDNSLDAASTMLGAKSPEPSSDPVVWGGINTQSTFGKVAAAPSDPDTIAKIDALIQSVIDLSGLISDITSIIVDAYMGFDTTQPGAFEKFGALRSELSAKYATQIQETQTKLFADANEMGRLINSLPQSTTEQKLLKANYANRRNGSVENLLKIADAQIRNVTDAKQKTLAKIGG